MSHFENLTKKEIKATMPIVTRWLHTTNPFFFNLYCIIFAFSTYFCMYAFRKPFSVATFDGQSLVFLSFTLDYKILFIISQVIGYTLSKFLGIKFVSETKEKNRFYLLLSYFAFAEFALVLFAYLPSHFKFLALLLNGLPLGMVWGQVFSYLEGRRFSEILGIGLSTSYIVASGAVKSVGNMFLLAGVSEYLMPMITGAIFLPLTYICVKCLSYIPKPTLAEQKERTKRGPMDQKTRSLFFKSYAPSFICLTLFYMLLTAYRDFRDNFSKEIWESVGLGQESHLFTSTELPIAFAVMISLAGLMFIKDNHKAVRMTHVLIIFGAFLIGISTLCFQWGVIGPISWMILIGLGLYLGYVPFGCILFDRIIAATGFVGTSSFMIYITDSFGYLGSVSLLFYKNFGMYDISWIDFFIKASYATSILCVFGFSYSAIYFYNLERKAKTFEVIENKMARQEEIELSEAV